MRVALQREVGHRPGDAVTCAEGLAPNLDPESRSVCASLDSCESSKDDPTVLETRGLGQ